MHIAPTPVRQVGGEHDVPSAPPAVSTNSPRKVRAPGRLKRLSGAETATGFVVLVIWLLLFGGGIMIDTEPYRQLISPSGADALRAAGQESPPAPPMPAAAALPSTLPGVFAAWLMVLACFVPLNLAWLCVASSTLGAVGSVANLSDDQFDMQSHDSTSPYVSALLRGFFVYLFMMSGLLLLDDAPFADAGPVQYIRLAGFLSLFSFVVSYHPRLFSALLSAASQRIQVRGSDGSGSLQSTDSDAAHASVDIDRGTVEVAMARRTARPDNE